MAWLGCEGRLSSQRLAALLNSRLDKNCVVVVDLSADTSAQTDALKAMAQQCLELTRIFYRNLAKRYKALLAAEPTKFLQPWMAAIYYYTKLAVVEEFRGDLQSALKYHHSILAKCKQMIEDARDNARMAMISFLRPSADVCFIRVHRMVGATEVSHPHDSCRFCCFASVRRRRQSLACFAIWHTLAVDSCSQTCRCGATICTREIAGHE